ncbi:hypothetical protein PHLGIDRAFT_130228 [Phlebiopsis gigantea 11061_1 CR5-6]|uniref:MARVEL domain-containing protein n=1 Tax=Phlebiopsis gigantea (strain 11061_1 CR5-6) TaxID=745531 RepID=A0A0C3NF73_PHLG1|nr:hypothetical protein PHLGIDRAFT_130228 [Phlebiopsis gigantea 11061_1 CR5-6]
MFSARRISWIFLAALAASTLPTAKADCWIDDFGIERCGLSNGARIGLAIALIILGLLAVASAYSYRRRRMQRFAANNVNYAGANNVNYYPGGYPPSPYNGYDPNGPQYPPQTYNSYNPQAGFAPPAGPPPGYYAPPQGPPPVTGKEMSV